jgi:imidazolonepropionase-like amidohydrolase
MLVRLVCQITQTVAATGLLIASTIVYAESVDSPPPRLVVMAGKILDVRTGRYLNDGAIYIEGEHVKSVGPAQIVLASVEADRPVVIDLHGATVLPGLIDCHTHLMARVPKGVDGYALNLLTKSEAYRALEGAADARITLRAGFTTVRDVENEGSGYADVALRDAITADLVEGPRMLVATRGIAALGQYEPSNVRADLIGFPTGAQMVSGVEEARRAVREQIGHGADVIKVYADWGHPTLTVAEMQVVVEEAHGQESRLLHMQRPAKELEMPSWLAWILSSMVTRPIGTPCSL